MYLFDLFLACTPAALFGILTSIFMKLPVLNFLKTPIDRGRILSDNQRLFGENKSWKGLAISIIFYGVSILLFYKLYPLSPWFQKHSLIRYDLIPSATAAFLWGGLQGLGYRLFELPNSYLKRRLNIAPGSQASGLLGLTFLFIDQVDSLFGLFLFLPLYYNPPLSEAILLFSMATFVHFLLHYLFCFLRLKETSAPKESLISK